MGLRALKWYLDLVAPDGEVTTGHAARIRWGVLKQNEAAGLRLDGAAL